MVKSYEMFYTGGGIWCVSGELEDGRFFNGSCDEGLNLFSTKEAEEASWESFCEEDPGFLGYPDEAECTKIFTEIYKSEIATDANSAAWYAERFLEYLEPTKWDVQEAMLAWLSDAYSGDDYAALGYTDIENIKEWLIIYWDDHSEEELDRMAVELKEAIEDLQATEAKYGQEVEA